MPPHPPRATGHPQSTLASPTPPRPTRRPRSLILAKGLDALLALSGERDAGKLLDALGGDPGKLSDLRRLTRQLARELQQGGPAREQVGMGSWE